MNNSEEKSAKSFKEVEIEFHTRNDVPLSITEYLHHDT
jgi:hypothetical protein